ncbi:MAG: Stp1/IreP family PP2C-type Ser/Thr phosphatase, partial [Actinomycetota bacterium]
MRTRVGATTDIGQVREGNEDAILISDPLYAVADGMGGHRGGEVASNLALQTVEHMFAERQGTLTEQVEWANRAVFERSQSDRDVSGMGTTLTAALIEGGAVRLAHVGDSRAYLFRGGKLQLLTEDHTLVHRMVVEGEITEAEAENHPHRSVLTRALGVEGDVRVDETKVQVREGDRLLLCTDGLTGMLSEDQIESILQDVRDPQEAVDRLVSEANRAGGIDNITAVIIDFTEDGRIDGSGTKEVSQPRSPTTQHPTPTLAPPPRAGGDVTTWSSPPTTRRQPAPKAARPPTARKLLVGIVIVLAIVALGFVGVRLYLDSQWFVGVSNGRVAIFRGVPAEVAGLEMNSVVVETSIR